MGKAKLCKQMKMERVYMQTKREKKVSRRKIVRRKKTAHSICVGKKADERGSSIENIGFLCFSHLQWPPGLVQGSFESAILAGERGIE